MDLTPDVITIVTDLQESDNQYLGKFRNIIGDAAFAILKLTRDEKIEIKQKYSQLLSDLELVRDELLMFKGSEE